MERKVTIENSNTKNGEIITFNFEKRIQIITKLTRKYLPPKKKKLTSDGLSTTDCSEVLNRFSLPLKSNEMLKTPAPYNAKIAFDCE